MKKNLVTILFGSHLYGTSTPESDRDYKSVHLPSATEILLGTAKQVISTSTKSDGHAKNTAEDIDNESFTFQKFLKLASEGQTVAVDMLFAPEEFWIGGRDPLWWNIVAERERLLTSQSASFVGYCRTQANKYGIRGSRVAAARAARDMLAANLDKPGADKLGNLCTKIEKLTQEVEHAAIIDLPTPQGGSVLHWEVCGRKMPFTASVKSAFEIMERVVKEYGHRALAAESNQGVDWKAVSHAVRIANQAIELLGTGHVTFPRPEAEHLLAIKTGKVPYADVAKEIDALLIEVEEAAASSELPAKPDLAWIDQQVISAYARVAVEAY